VKSELMLQQLHQKMDRLIDEEMDHIRRELGLMKTPAQKKKQVKK